MPRYVVLFHDHPAPHFDFLLEAGNVCRSWRLKELPRAGETISCEAMADHRLHYLTYEGPVSGGRGTVKRVVSGEYTLIREAPGRVEVETPEGVYVLRVPET